MLSHYVVHWAGYQAHLQSACCDQFLSEKFVDVTLAVDSGLIKCHRVILSAASGYFHQLLAQHDSAHPIIFMRDMQYWELIALVDFMYRGEVTVEADRLEQLMWSASQLQIHGLAACLKACLQRSSGNNTSTNTTQLGVTAENEQISAEGDGEMEDDSQESGEIGDTGIPPSLSKLCELNCELELRPITPSSNSGHTIVPSGGGRVKRGSLPPPPLQALNKESVPAAQKDVVKEEIEFIEEKPQLSPAVLEPAIQIQSVFSECSTSNEKGEASDDGNDIEEEEPTPATADSQKSDRTFRQFLLLSSMQGSSQSQESTQTLSDYNKLSLHDTPLYKRYSPRSLEQALRDLKTGRFRSIRACARHHGIPMTTLRYRAKGKTQRPAWLGQ